MNTTNPTWCIVVPYRDRAHHLAVFAPFYNKLFPNVPIFVIEQADSKPFNRAKLFNVAYCEIGNGYDFVAYHDVDMFVHPGMTTSYSFPSQPACLATECSQFKYARPYAEYFGGVTLLSREQMLAVNGWSNEYWSRNGEDDSMYRELVKARFVPQWRSTRYECFEHPRDINPALYKRNLQLLAQGKAENDGLNSCTYNIVSRTGCDGYTLIKVEL